MAKLAQGFIGGVVLVLAAIILLQLWANGHRLVDGPANQSLVYRSYEPEQVIRQFRDEHQGYTGGSGYGAAQGIRSIHRTRDFTPTFTMQADRERELLKALREDIKLRLSLPGTRVVAIDEQANGRSTYKYVSGQNVGTISVGVPAHITITRHVPLPVGLEDVVLKVDLDETWTLPPNERHWWMSVADFAYG